MQLQLVIIGALAMTAMAQRSSFAGSRGSGYKDGLLPQTAPTTNNNNIIGNRNGDGGEYNSNLPIDARGDAYLVNHYSSLPAEHQPFWLLNQHHIEAQRGTPQRPSSAVDNRFASNQFNGLDFPTRFNTDATDLGGFNSQSVGSNQNNQPGVVYPVNTSPEQRVAMEIQFLQQRLSSLSQIQNQLQQQPQQQPNQYPYRRTN